MKKKLLIMGLSLLFFASGLKAQTINEPANWPSTTWTIGGTYSTADLLADPTVDANFSYDDDGAGAGSTDSISVVSPIIDLSAAQTAGENFMLIDYEYEFNYGDIFEIQYWDADASAWVIWEDLPDNSSVNSAWCAELTGAISTSQPLDITAFSANQLSNFQYRILFDASNVNGSGFCMSSPTIYSVSCLDPSNLTAGNVSENAIELNWTENGSATNWNIEYGPTGFTPTTGTTVAATTNPFILTGLTSFTTYDIYLQSDCGGGDVSGWVGPITVTTTQIPVATFPWIEDFEAGTANWTFANGTETNQWTVGSAVNNGGTNSLYISQDGGTSHTYDNTASSVVHAFRDVQLPATAVASTMSFDYLCDGEGSNDHLIVWLVPTSYIPTDGTPITSTGAAPSGRVNLTGNLSEINSFSNLSFNIPNSYLGETFRIVFEWTNDAANGQNPPAAVDNINLSVFNCLAPSGIIATNIDIDEALISWDDNTVGASSFQIEYGPSGFTPGTGTTVTATDTFVMLTGLTPDEGYDVYVSADCNDGTFSSQGGPGSFTTLVACFPPSNLQVLGVTTTTIDLDWLVQVGGATDFIIEYGAPGFTPGTGTQVATPPYDLSGLNPETEYDVYVYSDCGALGLSQPIGPVNATTLPTCLPPSGITISDIGTDSVVVSWTENGTATSWNIEYGAPGFTLGSGTVITGATNPDTITGLTQLTDYEIYVSADCGSGDISDTIGPESFTTLPTCPTPTSLTLVTVGATTADVSWTVQGTETTWNLEYGAPGYTPGTGTSVSTTNNPETITGLTPQTDYDIYVQADCGGTDTSLWSGPISITTECGIQLAPYSEDFENGGSIPECWEQGASNSEDWDFDNSGFGHIGSSGTINGSTNSNGYFAWVDDSSPHSQNTELLSPLIDVSSLTNVAVSFFLLSDNEGETNVDFSLDVWDGAAWNNAVFTSNSNTANEAWEQKTAYLYSLTFTGPMQLRFVVDENNGNDFDDDVALDDVSVFEGPTCPAVSNIQLDSVSLDYADITWDAGGSETSWNIEYGPAGFTLGNGTTATTGTIPFAMTGLTNGTSYDVYVTADCGGGDLADTIGAFTFTTDPSCGDTIYDNGGPNGDYAANTDEIVVIRPAGTNQYVKVTFEEFEYESNYDGMYVYDGENVTAPLIPSSNGAGNGSVTTPGAYWGTNIPGPFTGEVLTFQFKSDGIIQDPGHEARIECFDCDVTPGQDGSVDICRLEDTLDLNSVITKGIADDPLNKGTWSFPADPALLNDSILDVSSLSAGSHEAIFILSTPCGGDTLIATVNVFDPSSAGQDGNITVCLNEPVNLFDGLNGTTDLGGTWYDPSNNALPNSQPSAGNQPGNFSYDYIASNNVCPADTALVTVTVDGTCNWLSLGEEKLTDISVYPNPATSVINITNPSNSESLRIEMLDMNGRVVIEDAKALANASEGTISIDHLEKGMYTLRIYNEEGQRTFKIVKQ